MTPTDDEPLSLHMVDRRIRKIEERDIEADILHRQLLMSDGQTAQAVERLADTINNPRTGLIVELERFRADVAADRRAFKAWVAGATAVISIVFTVVQLFAPAIRSTLGVP